MKTHRKYILLVLLNMTSASCLNAGVYIFQNGGMISSRFCSQISSKILKKFRRFAQIVSFKLELECYAVCRPFSGTKLPNLKAKITNICSALHVPPFAQCWKNKVLTSIEAKIGQSRRMSKSATLYLYRLQSY